VRLIDVDGNASVVPIEVALRKAQDESLDLVEINPQSQPPICKIMDYGKYKFQQEKKVKESKKKQHIAKLKEIKLRPQIGRHDLDFKMKDAIEFLTEGDKLKITVMFKGREIVHSELGRSLMDRVIVILQEHGQLEHPVIMEGRNLVGNFMPFKKSGKKKETPHAQDQNSKVSS
jgi:translation initiation factor IF-3